MPQMVTSRIHPQPTEFRRQIKIQNLQTGVDPYIHPVMAPRL